MARYVEITEEDFEQFFLENNLEVLSANERRIWENVYAIPINDETQVIIYSSIDKRTGKGRDVGKDAIRVCIRRQWEGSNGWRVVWKSRRLHRVAGWKQNLLNRLEDAFEQYHPEPCPYCGAALALREGQYGKFYSCIMWSKTNCQGKRKYDE